MWYFLAFIGSTYQFWFLRFFVCPPPLFSLMVMVAVAWATNWWEWEEEKGESLGSLVLRATESRSFHDTSVSLKRQLYEEEINSQIFRSLSENMFVFKCIKKRRHEPRTCEMTESHNPVHHAFSVMENWHLHI